MGEGEDDAGAGALFAGQAANTEGGSIYIGISDEGEILGLDDPDACIVRAAQVAANAIRPDKMLFVSPSNTAAFTVTGH